MISFKKYLEHKYIFKENNSFKQLLNLEYIKSFYRLTYLDNNCKKIITLNENNINSLTFYKKTNNIFYKKYIKITPSSLLTEMTTVDAGVSGSNDSQFSGDTYATGDARNIIGSKPIHMNRRNKIENIILKDIEKKKKKRKKKNGKSK